MALLHLYKLLMGMGGSVGIHPSSIEVRGMTFGRLYIAHIGSILFKEIRIGAIMVFVCGGGVGLIAPWATFIRLLAGA
ncbi:MAG: hypothetical protein SWO11_05460 [Thermodesulfobacteriota bacterium]|nr:hypothetical protein [Thermodesulfobacteriota bacterium]